VGSILRAKDVTFVGWCYEQEWDIVRYRSEWEMYRKDLVTLRRQFPTASCKETTPITTSCATKQRESESTQSLRFSVQCNRTCVSSVSEGWQIEVTQVRTCYFLLPVNIVTRLQARRHRRGRQLFSSPPDMGAHPASNGYRELFPHLHQVPRLRMSGAIPPLPNTSLWHST
jgi:hypothetical protein